MCLVTLYDVSGNFAGYLNVPEPLPPTLTWQNRDYRWDGTRYVQVPGVEAVAVGVVAVGNAADMRQACINIINNHRLLIPGLNMVLNSIVSDIQAVQIAGG